MQQIAARLGDGHPSQRCAEHLEDDEGDEQPPARSRQAHQPVADVFAADRRIAAYQIGDEDTFHHTTEQHKPQQAVARPGPHAHHDDGLPRPDTHGSDDGSRSENGQQSYNLLQRPGLGEGAFCLWYVYAVHASALT